MEDLFRGLKSNVTPKLYDHVHMLKSCFYSIESSVTQNSSSSEFSFQNAFPVSQSEAQIRKYSEVLDRKYLLSSSLRN